MEFPTQTATSRDSVIVFASCSDHDLAWMAFVPSHTLQISDRSYTERKGLHELDINELCVGSSCM